MQKLVHNLKYLWPLLFCFLAFSAQAYSVEPVQLDPNKTDFVVGPGKVDLVVIPGSSKTVEVMVTNRTGTERTFSVGVEDFVGSDGTDSVTVFTDDGGKYTLKDYISVPEKEFTLANGTRARIPVTVRIPVGAEPGGRYAGVIISTLNDYKKDNDALGAKGGVPLIARTGTLLFVTIPGEVNRDGELAAFQTEGGRWLYSSGKDVNFQIVFDNKGSIHLNPSGVLTVKNIFGEEIKMSVLDPWFVMPASVRTKTVPYFASPEESRLMIGRYVAEVDILKGYDNLSEKKNLVFWVIPWPLLLIIIAILLLVVWLVRFVVRFIGSHFELRRKDSSVSEHAVTAESAVSPDPKV